MNVSYECTVTDDDGDRSTIWRGSAFNCPSDSFMINLPHSLYEPGVRGSCGGLSAMSIGVSGNNYTSQLTLTANLGLNEMTVECNRGGTIVVGNDTLKTGGK